MSKDCKCQKKCKCKCRTCFPTSTTKPTTRTATVPQVEPQISGSDVPSNGAALPGGVAFGTLFGTPAWQVGAGLF